MKKLVTSLSIASVLSVCTLAQAQSQDTAIARIDNTKKTEGLKATESNPKNEVVSDQITVEPNAKFILPQPQEKSTKGSLNNKVGPQGEEVFRDNRKFYYFNSEGQKVKIKSNELRDKPKHS
jgi:hypothetical protein